MTDDTNATTAEPLIQDTANAANPGQGQTVAADAGAGTVDAATSSGDDQASSSITQTSSEAGMKRLTEQLESRHSQSNQGPQTIAPPTAQQLTMDQVNQALGITSPDDLKRIVNERSLFGRQANEVGQLRQQVQQFQQQVVAEKTRQEQESQRANLSPFHAKHPQFQANQSRIANANAFNAASSVLNPQDANYQQQRQQMAANMGVNGEDLRLANDAKQYRDRIMAEQASDPEGFVESRAMRAVQAQLQQFEQYLNSRNQAQSFVQQHAALINDPRSQQLMSEVLDERTSRADLAVRIANLEREKAEFLSRKTNETAEVENLRARDALANTQVVSRRRASTQTTNPTADPWESYEDSKSDPKAQEKLLKKLLSSA